MLDLPNLIKVGNFDPTTIAQLADALGAGVNAIAAAGTLPITAGYSQELTIVGTMAFTLPAPTVAGQRTKVTCVSATTTPAGTLTVTSPETLAGFVCAGAFLFNAAGQSVEFVASSGLKWRATRIQRQGTQAVVVGTTVLTGINLAANYSLSVTGTVSSTTTKGIPDGSAPGETMQVGCNTAASIPVGSISITALTTLGVAGTTLGNFGATSHYATVMWNGTGWMLVGNNTAVLS